MFQLKAAIIGVTTLIVSCASHADDATAFRRSLDEVEDESALHAAHCQESDSLESIAEEMDRHDGVMADVFDSMHGGFEQMGQCYRGERSMMSGMMSELERSEGDHSVQMRDAATLPAAIAECAQHSDALTRDVDEMRQRLDTDGHDCMM